MKILNIGNRKVQNISCTGGMSRSVWAQINSIDCAKTEKFFINRGINADFAENKVVAWSVKKVFDALNQLGKSIGVDFALPVSITVDNIKKYSKASKGNNVIGFVNFLPCKLQKNCDEITPPMSIIFNKDFHWKDLNGISDERYLQKLEVSQNFLSPFIHEFGHIIHEGNIIKKYKLKDIQEKINILFDGSVIDKYRKLYGEIVSRKLCDYASENMLELIACDITKRFLDCMNSELCITNNAFQRSPYNKYYKLKMLFKKDEPYNELVSKVYNCNKNLLV